MRERANAPTDRRLRTSGIAGGRFGNSDKHVRSRIKGARARADRGSISVSYRERDLFVAWLRKVT